MGASQNPFLQHPDLQALMAGLEFVEENLVGKSCSLPLLRSLGLLPRRYETGFATETASGSARTNLRRKFI